MTEKQKNEARLNRLKNRPELFRTFKEEPRAVKEFDFNDDGERFTIIYKSIGGAVFSRHNYRISDYKKTWYFADDNSVDLTPYKFDIYKLREVAEKAVDNRLKTYNESINKCFNDVIKDLSFRVEDAANKGRYSVSSGINIYIGKYLDESDIDELTIKQRDDWSRIITKKLDEYFKAKGFNTDHILQSNYYTLDWSYKETKDEWEPNTLADTYKGKKKVTGILSDIEGDNYTVGIKAYGTLTSSNENTLKPIYDEMNLWNEVNDNCDYTIGDVNPLSKGLYSDIKCPYCGARHYEEGMTMNSLGYVPRIYKDGVLQDAPNPNWSVTHFHCLDCGKDFETRNGKVQKIENVVTTQGGEINVQSQK